MNCEPPIFNCQYKIGDKVKLKDNLVPYKTYNRCMFTKEMESYKNKVLEIESSFFSFFYKRYFLKDIEWEFSEEMLELVKKRKK